MGMATAPAPEGILIATHHREVKRIKINGEQLQLHHTDLQVWEQEDGTFNLHTLEWFDGDDAQEFVRHYSTFYDLYTWLQHAPHYGMQAADRLIDAMTTKTVRPL